MLKEIEPINQKSCLFNALERSLFSIFAESLGTIGKESYHEPRYLNNVILIVYGKAFWKIDLRVLFGTISSNLTGVGVGRNFKEFNPTKAQKNKAWELLSEKV